MRLTYVYAFFSSRLYNITFVLTNLFQFTAIQATLLSEIIH